MVASAALFLLFALVGGLLTFTNYVRAATPHGAVNKKVAMGVAVTAGVIAGTLGGITFAPLITAT